MGRSPGRKLDDPCCTCQQGSEFSQAIVGFEILFIIGLLHRQYRYNRNTEFSRHPRYQPISPFCQGGQQFKIKVGIAFGQTGKKCPHPGLECGLFFFNQVAVTGYTDDELHQLAGVSCRPHYRSLDPGKFPVPGCCNWPQ